MGRMLPGEADATVELNAFLSSMDGDIGAVRLGEGRRHEAVLARIRPGCRGVPGDCPRCLDLDEEIGRAVLERLVAADESAELTPLEQIANSRVEAPLRDAELLGGEECGTDEERLLH